MTRISRYVVADAWMPGVLPKLLDLEVFEREGEDAPGLDTAIFVLVDKSRSMSSTMSSSNDASEAVALDTILALGDTLPVSTAEACHSRWKAFLTR